MNRFDKNVEIRMCEKLNNDVVHFTIQPNDSTFFPSADKNCVIDNKNINAHIFIKSHANDIFRTFL